MNQGSLHEPRMVCRCSRHFFDKDPCKPISIMECHKGFERCSNVASTCTFDALKLLNWGVNIYWKNGYSKIYCIHSYPWSCSCSFQEDVPASFLVVWKLHALFHLKNHPTGQTFYRCGRARYMNTNMKTNPKQLCLSRYLLPKTLWDPIGLYMGECHQRK